MYLDVSFSRMVSCVGVSVAIGLSGCVDDPAGRAAEGVQVDETEVLARLAKFRTAPDFVRVNAWPYPSALDPSKFINVYISTDALLPFSQVAPEVTGTGVDVPEGALIVRETLDSRGTATALTLMYKGPPGYNPELGDFWFGVTDPWRVPLVENGAEMSGKLEACYDCHRDRSSDGYLFGVPQTNRLEDW